MFKHLILVGAALLGAGLSLTASAAVSVVPITVQCPETVVGSESVCTITGTPWTGVRSVAFINSGTRTSDDTGPFTTLSATVSPQFRVTPVTPTPSDVCKVNKSYSATSSCSYPNVITFKPIAAGTYTGSIHFKWVASGGCTGSCPETFITITGTAIANPTYTYQWQSSQFSSCGGPGTWTYGDWLPAVGSACTTSLEQTRSATCVGTPDAGTQVRNVECVRDQDGVVVADSFCPAPKPATTQSCTPTNPSCGTKDAIARTVSDLSTCTYEWSPQTWTGCGGGSGEWMVGERSPTTGCGVTQQLRSVACSVIVDSGAMTRDVDCMRSDGTQVADAQCQSQTRPALTQPCTPTGNVCGATPATQQTVNVTNDCSSEGGEDEGASDTETPAGPTPVKKELCTPDAANHKYCVWMPL